MSQQNQLAKIDYHHTLDNFLQRFTIASRRKTNLQILDVAIREFDGKTFHFTPPNIKKSIQTFEAFRMPLSTLAAT